MLVTMGANGVLQFMGLFLADRYVRHLRHDTLPLVS